MALPLSVHAWSTNTDIWTIQATGGAATNRTEANKGSDAQPAYSTDGRSLAYLCQSRAGFESDLWVLKVRDLESGAETDVSSYLDRPVLSYAWKAAGMLMGVIDSGGFEPIVLLSTMKRKEHDGTTYRPVVAGVNSAISIASDGRSMTFLQTAANRPAEVHVWRESTPKPLPLTSHNRPVLDSLDLGEAEGFKFKGSNGDEVSGWLVKPPGFDAAKKYPVLFLIHGGPQGAWHDEWHARWNYQLFAAPGYVVVAINPRGSTGYGQKFTDQISKDWNGKVYEDLMKGLDHALATYPFLDKDRMAAAGGSYGGYMVNWILGHAHRFKCLISHAGVFDLTSKYGTTEELWFPDWEFGGPPWKDDEVANRYLDQSPSRYVANFKTPTLVTHGALDFRVPDAQGIGLFTALQRQGVESRLVLFPDEGHWILKPANRVAWWREMHGWLAKHLK